MNFQQTNILSMTGGDDFATLSDLSGYVTLSTAQSVSGLKTFTTLPESSIVATTANQLTNKTYVDGLVGNYVTLSTAQTITGVKTFSANVRFLNTRNLYFGTTTGGILNYTLPNMYYDINSGGSHYFFVGGSPSTRVESTGLFIENGKYINWFGGSWLYENNASSRFEYNAPSGFNHSLRINNVEQLQIDATLGAVFTGEIRMKYPYAFYPNDAFTGGSIRGTAGGGFRFDADVGEDYKFVCDGTLALTINGLGTSIPNNLVAEFGVANCNIGYASASTSLRYRVPTGTYYHRWFSGTTELMSLSGVAFYGLRTNNIDIFLTRGNKFYMDTSGNYIGMDTSGNINYQANMGTGRNNFYTGATLGAYVDAQGITMVDNAVLTFGTTVTTNNISCNASNLQYNVPTGKTHLFRINATTQVELLTTGIKVVGGYLGRLGTAGAFGTVYNNSNWTGTVLNAYADNTLLGAFTISDRRIKENIRPAGNVLDRLCQLQMVNYELKDIGIFKKSGNHLGFFADDLQDLFPELNNLVSGTKDQLQDDGITVQPQTVNPETTNLYLRAIQELNQKIEAQQKQIDGLVLALSKIISP